MNPIDSNLLCPACQNLLQPKILSCSNCDVRVEGPFQFNEFATLSPEDLHFLRIFVRCEGRVRDMEPALGLSYPTIRSRLSELKDKLSAAEGAMPVEAPPAPTQDPQQTLQLLEQGKITFDEAMQRIKNPGAKRPSKKPTRNS